MVPSLGRGPDRLALGALHVSYEMGQMVDAALRIDAASDAVTENALLEATLLHARALLEFLLGTGRGSDIRAEHLAPEWQLEDAEARSELEEIKAEIDQHLAHLTWARVDEGEQQWRYPLLARNVIEAMRTFTMDDRLVPQAADPLRLELERIDRIAAVGSRTSFFESDVTTTTSSPSVIVMSQWNDPLELTRFERHQRDDDDGEAKLK